MLVVAVGWKYSLQKLCNDLIIIYNRLPFYMMDALPKHYAL